MRERAKWRLLQIQLLHWVLLLPSNVHGQYQSKNVHNALRDRSCDPTATTQRECRHILPPEILALILTDATPTAAPISHSWRRRVSLTLVCRRWREVAPNVQHSGREYLYSTPSTYLASAGLTLLRVHIWNE